MRLRYALGWIFILSVTLTAARAGDPQLVPVTAPNDSNLTPAGYPDLASHSLPALYAQNWPGVGYSFLDGESPYGGSGYFPYLYFYEQYSREAEESRRAADEFEASLAREGKLTGPLPAGAFATDSIPGSPLDLPVTLDGQSIEPSPSGAPLVIESGKHELQIGSAGTTPAN